jgi:serine/threonine protein kinase
MHRIKGGKPPRITPDKASYEAFHDVRRLSSEDPLAGAIINDRYEMIGRIGSGGMAKVYLAMDRETHARVAIKIISDNPGRMDEITERFFVEAKAAGMINHPNIIGIKDIGTYRDKIFCVMEYLEGFDLSALIANRQGISWERAKKILAQVCDALEAAHQKGVIHRDMKPENVMLIPNASGEFVKVLDFGLARLTDSSERLTHDNIVLGTPSYMAPEQAWSSEYDHRVDIYALGVMAYEMVCGRVPFFSDIPDEKARMLQVLLMHKETPPDSMRARKPDLDIPPFAEAAIMRALDKDPSKRFASAREFKEALIGCVKQEGLIRKCADAAPQQAPASAQAPDDVGAPQDLDEVDSGRWTLPREEETIGRILKRFAKRMLAIGVIAAAIGIPAYIYRSEIFRIYSTQNQKMTERTADETPRTERPLPAPVQTSYAARIESTPRGANVTDVTGDESQGRVIGRTPLDTSFQNYENVLMVTKRGYYPARITVTRSQPEQRVTLKMIPRQSAAPGNGTDGPGDYTNRGDGGGGIPPGTAGMQNESP